MRIKEIIINNNNINNCFCLVLELETFWRYFDWCSVHGKTTDEWHTNDIRVHTSGIRMTYEWHTSTYEWHTSDMQAHTSDIRMTYEYIQVTYGWYRSTYEWHTDDIRVHTSDIRVTYEYIRVTYGWHTSDMRIASAKSRSARGASHRSAFTGSYLTISHRCLPCLPSRLV